ncbi:unnamed protein product [Paramecium sonneborni]|uniref:Schlafen AlbA-2 domain-containing protein n=1 Tax=Paramecium sonneborni TaxID=65129 RepID=A0A8S1LSA3_9CILI|nr:unnamed protein product [Paramecium sonneborni]
MNKQNLQEFKINICQNTLCQVRQDHVLSLQYMIQCQYYHNNNDKRRDSNNYKPILTKTINQMIFAIILLNICIILVNTVLFHAIFQNLRIAMLDIVHLNMMNFKQNKYFKIKYSPNQIRSQRAYQKRMMDDIYQNNQLLFNSKKYIQHIEINQFQDLKLEFKQFREIRMELIKNYICGILYIGINDKGMVQGIKMTRKQIVDFQIELDNNLRHFDSIVFPEQIELMSVPIYKDELIIIQDLFIIEIKFNVVDKQQLYFTNLNEAYIQRNATINQLKPKEIKDLVLLKLMNQFYICTYQLIQKQYQSQSFKSQN